MQRIVIAAVAVIAAGAVLNDAEAAPRKPHPSHTLDVCPVMCESAATVEGREPSLLPKGKKFKLVWNDEFDGEALDTSKWGYRTALAGLVGTLCAQGKSTGKRRCK